MKKIGFFGGCFNPPTIAHMEIAERALKDCDLDKIIFVPMGNKYSKKELVDFEFRFEMLNLCCKDNATLEVSVMQKNQPERMYAIDTFKEIEKKYNDSENFYIMGIDNFIKMKDWKLYNELINKYQYIVFKRNNILDLKQYDNVQFIDFEFNISSSCVRELLKNNKPMDGLLNKDVEQYIKNKNLYK